MINELWEAELFCHKGPPLPLEFEMNSRYPNMESLLWRYFGEVFLKVGSFRIH